MDRPPARTMEENKSNFHSADSFISINKDSILNSTLKEILHESTSLFSQSLELNESTLAKVEFRTKWQRIMVNLISLANRFEEQDGFENAVGQYKKLTSHESSASNAWFALGHCYLLKHHFQESFAAYKKALFSGDTCHDLELWYIAGILFDKVKCFLILVARV